MSRAPASSEPAVSSSTKPAASGPPSTDSSKPFGGKKAAPFGKGGDDKDKGDKAKPGGKLKTWSAQRQAKK